MTRPRRGASRSGAVEKELDAVAACRADPTSAAAQETLRRVLERGGSFAVAGAAALVGEHELAELAPLLAPAYRRVADRDPGCKAKGAIVEALCRLGRDERDVYLSAVRCRQLEAAWGPPVDTAAALRPQAAAGLAAMLAPEAGVEIARLLADKEWVSRAGAARAAARLDPDVGGPLLILKASAGDPEPEVLGDCFRSLLAIAPDRHLGFVVERLDAEDPSVAEAATLALGESRVAAAFAPLRDLAERATGTRRRAALLALALLRHDAANAYLLDVLEHAAAATALLALEALAVHKYDPRLRAATLSAVAAHGDRALAAKADEILALGG